MRLARYDSIMQSLHCYERLTLNTDYPRAAVLLPLLQKDDGLYVIFTQRSKHLNIHRGEVAFPGGKFDARDANLQETALRESHEEVDLCAKDVTILGQCSDLLSTTGIQVTPFVGALTQDVTLCPNQGEIEEIFTVPINFFLQSDCETLTLRKKGYTLNVPKFQFHQYKIWGLTALILVEFLNVAFDAGLTQFKQRAVMQDLEYG